MGTFKEANQIRLSLKMKFSMYAWYSSSAVTADSDGFAVTIYVHQLHNQVRKTIPQVIDGINIKTELERK
jgi:hypothetical protein